MSIKHGRYKRMHIIQLRRFCMIVIPKCIRSSRLLAREEEETFS